MTVVHILDEHSSIPAGLCGGVNGVFIGFDSEDPVEGQLCKVCLGRLGGQRMNQLITRNTSLGLAVKAWAYTVPSK